ncbi:6-phospho-3-hexuloisomerase [Paenibacillus sp. MWE-103]|uniref:6-phospho-3-hexuloisomerase n=1 Tax=Paenibacillus artemisiicola TaxID=1172618 RepID=A0ABS3WFT7_9BACL|nr:6-phospho-3-hexuloisomerase [Paenibacillus artemisiicola]MBO7747172.1 6-phospho-3-hexuloisomerase [Paenibacillus artemisiicola]
MTKTPYAADMLGELTEALTGIAEERTESFAALLLGARRVFVAGAGRSGLMMRAFAMRLMHLGLNAHVVGDTATPGLRADDVLVVGSGSGETGSLAAMAEQAKRLGAAVALVTASSASRIGRSADEVVRIPGATNAEREAPSVQPMGSLFEQALLLYLDALVLRLMERLAITEDAMKARHANLE